MIITCAKTNLPILGGLPWFGHPFSKVVLLREGRPPAAGWYDGAGGLGGLDLLTSGVRDEIEAGTACLVVGSSYRSGDTPSNVGRSRVWIESGRGPSREFIAACERLGGFATFEGLALACDGKVSPDLGSVLTATQVTALDRLGHELRHAVATRLTALPSLGPRRPRLDTTDSIASAVGLEFVPLDPELRTLRILGGQGLEVGGSALLVRHERGTLSPDLDELAADLIGGFPPRKSGSVTLVRDGAPEGTLTRYGIPELSTFLHVSATLGSVGVFGPLAPAVEALGLTEDEAEDVAQAFRARRSFADVVVSLPARAGRSP